jgi:hypothetical protein
VWTVLVETSPARSFGQALVLVTRAEASSVDLLVEADRAGDVARRAAHFEPTPTVWAISGTSLAPAVPSTIASTEPAPLEPHLAKLLSMPEVTVVVEHGWIIGECRGLEVARISGVGDEQRLDVGVGAYDQGAFAVMNPDLTPDESLAEVVAQVLQHRRRGAEPHPLNRLVRERWLRSELIADPTPLGLAALEAVEGDAPREGLYDVAPAFAWAEEERVLVACSVGIDLDLVPAAADVAARQGAERIVLVLPERDQHAMTTAVAARCGTPIDIVTADVPWPVV